MSKNTDLTIGDYPDSIVAVTRHYRLRRVLPKLFFCQSSLFSYISGKFSGLGCEMLSKKVRCERIVFICLQYHSSKWGCKDNSFSHTAKLFPDFFHVAPFFLNEKDIDTPAEQTRNVPSTHLKRRILSNRRG